MRRRVKASFGWDTDGEEPCKDPRLCERLQFLRGVLAGWAALEARRPEVTRELRASHSYFY